MHNSDFKKTAKASKFLEPRIPAPEVILVLGSGLGELAECIENPIEIPYARIPGFFESTVSGHSGKLLSGKLFGKQTAVLCGRFHPYEGHSPKDATLPIAALALLGAKTLIVTNAAGGINEDFSPGDVMLISDHINITGNNPLIGPYIPELGGERFTDMSDCYASSLRSKVQTLANQNGVSLKEGVYAYRLGPCYETPAEVRMLKTIGADAVGMSTVHEATMAAHMHLEVLGVSVITNKAAGLGDKLNHADVLEVGKHSNETVKKVIEFALCNTHVSAD